VSVCAVHGWRINRRICLFHVCHSVFHWRAMCCCDKLVVITFHVSRKRCEMYCGHAHLCVCLSVCLSAAACPHYCTDPNVTWGSGRDAPSCALLGGYGNITRTWNVSEYMLVLTLCLVQCSVHCMCRNCCVLTTSFTATWLLVNKRQWLELRRAHWLHTVYVCLKVIDVWLTLTLSFLWE